MRKNVAGVRLLCLPLFLLTGVLSRAAQGGSTYSDTTTDFRRFLQEIVDASKSGDEKRIESLLKSTEVPNCIGADGAVYNAHALSGEGLSEDPSLRKAAEEAVLQ